jgi:flagellar basal body-associated protein FliL
MKNNNNNTLGVRVFVTKKGLVISSNDEQKELEKKYPEITDSIISLMWRQNLKTFRVEMEVCLDEEKQKEIN